MIPAGQTAVADRGYQGHALFDSLQFQGKSFVIRIKANTAKTIIDKHLKNLLFLLSSLK